MTTYTTVNLESFEKEVDLNSLFTLTYNFDLLKNVLMNLVKSQKFTEQKLNDMEDKMKEKEKSIQDLNKEILELKEKSEKEEFFVDDDDQQIKFDDDKIDFNLDDRDKEKDIDREREKEKDKSEEKIYSRKETTNVVNENFSLNLTKDPTLNKIIKKVNMIDYQVKNIAYLNSDVNELKRKVKDHDDSLDNQNLSIKEIQKIIDSLRQKQTEFENSLQEINFKIISIDTSSMFKRDEEDTKNYGNEELTGMILALEKKLTTKIAYIDERFKKNEDDILKLRQLEKTIDQTNKNLDQTNKNLDWAKEQITLIYGRLEDIKSFSKNLNDTTFTTLKEDSDKLKHYFEEKFIEINTTIQTLLDNPPVVENQTGNVTTTNYDEMKIKELQRRVTELEKNFRNFSSTINIDVINNQFAKIIEALENKASKQDLQDLKDLYNEISISINYLKDNLSQLHEDRKLLDDLNFLRKKVETLSTAIINIKNNEENTINSPTKVVQIDNSRFVDTNTFNEFKRDILKEFDNVNMAITELKSLIEEILNGLKTKLSEKDLRNLEDYLMQKIEELKTGCQKKFADKNETAKNLKYLDGQIKHIIELYIKKVEKGDNWLLAKKPLGGYSCASCESYIGELHDNIQQYVPWNKYPMRDPNDKLYRIGNGFSKMLQMINVENTNNKPRNTQTSHDFFKQAQENPEMTAKKEVNLPRVKSNINPNVNMSADDIGVTEAEHADEQQPKIVKIFKKSKEKKIE